MEWISHLVTPNEKGDGHVEILEDAYAGCQWQKISPGKNWKRYDLRQALTGRGMERFLEDWNPPIRWPVRKIHANRSGRRIALWAQPTKSEDKKGQYLMGDIT